MNVILTGSTGMVGEGVLLECLDNPEVTKVLSVSRRPSGRSHPKLEELLLKDVQTIDDAARAKRTGCDACFYCAGISSAGLKERRHVSQTIASPSSIGLPTRTSFVQRLRSGTELQMLHAMTGSAPAATTGTSSARLRAARAPVASQRTCSAWKFPELRARRSTRTTNWGRSLHRSASSPRSA